MAPGSEQTSTGQTAVARLRLARRLTREQLAAAAGISVRTLQRFEHGEIYNPGIRHLLALAAALDCPLDELIEPDWRPAAEPDWRPAAVPD